jgi:hypothetical protein
MGFRETVPRSWFPESVLPALPQASRYLVGDQQIENDKRTRLREMGGTPEVATLLP